MRLQALSENLRPGVAELQRVTPARPALMTLSQLKVETRDGRVVIAATDLTQYVEYTTGARVEEGGASLVEGGSLSKIIGTFGDVAVEIAGNGAGATLSAGKRSVKLPGGNPDDFPPALLVDRPVCSVLAAHLLDTLTRVLPAACTDATRPTLNGINVAIEDGKMTLCAADGFRLAFASIPVQGRSEHEFNVPLPVAKTLIRLLKRAKETDVQITSGQEDATVRFDFGPWSVTAQMTQGSFPAYASLIPSPTETVTFARDDFTPELAAAAVLASENSGIIRIVSSDDALVLTSTDGDGATFATEIVADTSGRVRIALFARYLTDALSAVGSERIALGFNSTTSPVLLYDPDALQVGPSRGVHVVVMPMSARWD